MGFIYWEKLTQVISLTLFLFVISGSLASSTWAAQMRLSPSSGQLSTGETIAIHLEVIPDGSPIAGIDTVVAFDPEIWQVQAIEGSKVFASYPTKTFDNSKGTITISALASSAISKTEMLAKIQMTAKKAGQASLKLKTDNQQTVLTHAQTTKNVFKSANEAVFTITQGGDGEAVVKATATKPDNKEEDKKGEVLAAETENDLYDSEEQSIGGFETESDYTTPELPKAGHSDLLIFLSLLGAGTLGFGLWQKLKARG